MVAAEVALVIALHLAGSSDYAVPLRSIGDWLGATDPAVVLVAVARLSALVIGYWLLTTTVLYAIAHLLGWHGLAGLLRWVTLPVVRRVVQGVTAVSLTSASLLGPATVSVAPVLAQGSEIAQGDDTDTSGGEDGEAEPGDGDEAPAPPDYPLDAAGWPDLGDDSDFWRPSALPAPQITGDGTYPVVAGDHLWSIAEIHLRQAVGRDVTEDEICQYWVRLIEANRATIRSGDPDLIYPHEQLTLPPVFSD